ncbi:MAG: flagellin [Myxococcota bacterium]|nr:flagellin [Myxococcota bacterium]
MALTVLTNLTALKATNTLNKTQGQLSSTLGRISSGLRVNSASDDAAGLGVATTLNTEANSMEQAMRNANDGISIIQTAEGATTEATNILNRMRELAVQSASETLADTERGYINEEYDQLNQELGRIASVTEFNGVQLSDGTTTQINAQVGIDNATTSQITIELGDLTSTTLGVNSLDLTTSTNSLGAIDRIDTALDLVSSQRSTLGAVQNRLDSSLSNSTSQLESMRAAESQIMDADFAKESTEMTKLQIMQQAGVASLAQAKNINQAVLSLLS